MNAQMQTSNGKPRSQLERAAGMTRSEADEVLKRMKTSSVIDWVRVDELKVDLRAQRLLRKVWVKRHVPVFDPNQIGILCVSKRAGEPFFWTIDGQHRTELLRAVGWGDQSVNAEIFSGLTIQEEAALFLSRNDRISVRTFDKFKAGVTAEEPANIAIEKICSSLGLAIAEGGKDSSISSVSALLHVYSGAGMASEKEGATALRLALQAIEAAWGKSAANFQGQVIEATGLVLLRYGAKVDQNGLVARLAKIPGGATKLLLQGRGLRELHGGSLTYCIAAVIVQGYNRGRRSGKLESWWS